MVRPDIGAMERQLRRQSIWLRDSLQWIMQGKVLDGNRRPTALDLGCGPAFVMESLGELVDVRGVDVDEDMVMACRARGLEVETGSVYDLPFQDGTFDIIHCTFLMLWLEDPHSALAEMPGVVILDDPNPDNPRGGPLERTYPTALDVRKYRDAVLVGRVREDPTVDNGLNIWCVSDNLRKGAALNVVQIGEGLIER